MAMVAGTDAASAAAAAAAAPSAEPRIPELGGFDDRPMRPELSNFAEFWLESAAMKWS